MMHSEINLACYKMYWNVHGIIHVWWLRSLAIWWFKPGGMKPSCGTEALEVIHSNTHDWDFLMQYYLSLFSLSHSLSCTLHSKALCQFCPIKVQCRSHSMFHQNLLTFFVIDSVATRQRNVILGETLVVVECSAWTWYEATACMAWRLVSVFRQEFMTTAMMPTTNQSCLTCGSARFMQRHYIFVQQVFFF